MSHENELPASVRKQIEQADKIYAEVYKTDDEETPAEETPAEETPAEETPAQTPPVEDTAEHRFKVLQGKYNKEVPRLHKQLRESQQLVTQLNGKVSALEAKVAELLAAPAQQPSTPALTQEEIDTFGPDLIDIIRRVTREETGVVLDAQLKPVKESVKQVQEKVAPPQEDDVDSERKQMLVDLATAVPDWETQNEDPKFLKWLEEKNPLTDRVRMEELAEAYRSCDGENLIDIFKGFQKENAIVTPDETPNETPETPPAEQTPEQPLDELVAPGTPKTGPTGAQNEAGKKIWTKKEVDQFYAYKNELIKKNPEKDLPDNVVAAERDLFQAQHEGRIRP